MIPKESLNKQVSIQNSLRILLDLTQIFEKFK